MVPCGCDARCHRDRQPGASKWSQRARWYPPYFRYHLSVNGGMADNHKGMPGQSVANTDTVQEVGSQHMFVLVDRVQDPITI